MAPQSPTGSLSAAQPTRSSSGGSGPDISPAGSPPLILAFLAIGIFSAAMIAVFGWRRVQYPREGSRGAGTGVFLHDGGERRFGGRGHGGHGGHGGGAGGGGGASAGTGGGGCASRFGEKPVLWDLCTDSGGNSKVYMAAAAADYGTWDNIMPLAVAPASNGKSSSSQGPSNETLWSPQGRRPSSSSSLSAATSPLSPPPPPPPPLPPLRPVLLYSILGPRALASRVVSSTQHHSSSSRIPGESPRSRRHQRGQQQQRFDDLTPLSLLRRHVRGEANSNSGEAVSSSAAGGPGNNRSHAEGLDSGQRQGGVGGGGGEADHPSGRKEIRIAVIIEMPSPRRRRTTSSAILPRQVSPSESEEHVAEKEGEDRSEEVVRGGAGQYCIGVHTCALPVVTDTAAASGDGGGGKEEKEEKEEEGERIRSVS